MFRKLTLIWGALDFLLLAAGALTVAFSFLWRAPDLVINMTISSTELTAGLVLGILLILTALLAIPSILPAPTNNSLLKLLNGAIVVDIIAATVVGTMLWFTSLRQRIQFWDMWERGIANADRTRLENMFQCCGYWNGTTAGGFLPPDPTITLAGAAAPFCSDATFAAAQIGCVGSITKATDQILEVSFSTVYGWVVILILLGLATTCLINERTILVRFLKIDAKRGGSGFV